LLKKIFLFLFFLVLVSFGGSNTDNISVGLWPLIDKISLPIYLFFYLSFTLGIVLYGLYNFLKSSEKND
tara:strand:+ start:163 stop:369 length:207 start_codon:yes stop_codon:yes gene_type:complete